MYLFFDTETNGLPRDYKASVNDVENWPRMVQLAWQVYNERGELQKSESYIIKPEGFEIPEQAVAIHGISTEKALAEGVDLKDTLEKFLNDVYQSKYLVGHNVHFDDRIVRAEMVRKEIDHEMEKYEKFCTMQSSVNFCQLPGNYGYKWPNLSELHLKLFDSLFENAHDALADVEACARCFFELKDRGVINI